MRPSSQFCFPLSHDAIDALLEFRTHSLVHLHLVIRGGEIQVAGKRAYLEQPILGSTDELADEELLKKTILPTGEEVDEFGGDDHNNNIGYHLFAFDHLDPVDHELMTTVLFVYIRPSSTDSSLRTRMMYTAMVCPVMRSINELISPLEIAKRLDLDTGRQLTIGAVVTALYPQLAIQHSPESRRYINTTSNGPVFAKPTPPAGRRGSRRLIR